MSKALFIYESHRKIEFFGMMQELNSINGWASIDSCIDIYGYSFEDMVTIVNGIETFDVIVTHESDNGEPDGKNKAPLVLGTEIGLSFLNTADVSKILKDENIHLSLPMFLFVWLAAFQNKTIIIIPGRGDDLIDPTYTPPKCWFDRIPKGGRAYFYKYNVKGGCLP